MTVLALAGESEMRKKLPWSKLTAKRARYPKAVLAITLALR